MKRPPCPAGALTPLCGVKYCFVIICAVTGRILIFLFATIFAAGDALDDTVGQWAKKISAHLAADEVAHVTWRDVGNNAASAGYWRCSRVRASESPASSRTAAATEESQTGGSGRDLFREPNGISVDRGSAPGKRTHRGDREHAKIDRATLAESDAPAGSKARVEQPSPILDVTVTDDTMLVLDSSGITIYGRGNGGDKGIATDAKANQPREGPAHMAGRSFNPFRSRFRRFAIFADGSR